MEALTGLEPRLDQLSKKIQEIRERSQPRQSESVDSAMGVIEGNLGRQEARLASMDVKELSGHLLQQQGVVHSLDPAKVADLISDPFED